MKTLSKAAIQAAQDIKREPFPIPEWGEDSGVFLTELSGNTRAGLLAAHDANKDKDPAARNMALEDALIVACVTDEKGKAIFEAADADMLRTKNSKVRERIAAAAMKLNGMGKVEEAAEVKQ